MFVCQLDRLVEKQRETYRRMLEQLLLVERAHRQTLGRLEDEKRNHGDFMRKSDEFTGLLEQERERSVIHTALALCSPAPFDLIGRLKCVDQTERGTIESSRT